MDDLKTYAKNDDEQTGLLKTIKSFSDDIDMEFVWTSAPRPPSRKGD